MTKHSSKGGRSLDLKIAIIQSRQTQRQIAIETEIGEVRLSEIVCCRGLPATPDEKKALARRLKKSIGELFPPVERDRAADVRDR